MDRAQYIVTSTEIHWTSLGVYGTIQQGAAKVSEARADIIASNDKCMVNDTRACYPRYVCVTRARQVKAEGYIHERYHKGWLGHESYTFPWLGLFFH